MRFSAMSTPLTYLRHRLHSYRRCFATQQTPPEISTPPQPQPYRHPVDNASFHDYTLRDLMRARVHMGHRTKLWNPRMAQYLLGHRNGMHIIDLDKTIPLMRRALTAVSLMAEHDCTFLWLGPRDVQKAKIIEREARLAGAYTIDGARWIGGTLTNPISSQQVERFNYRVPDCLFVVDVNRHIPALKEARVVGIPTIGIADSDCDPTFLTYPIPGNDDNALAIFLYCSLMKHAIRDGRHRGRQLNRPSFSLSNAAAEPPRRPRPLPRKFSQPYRQRR